MPSQRDCLSAIRGAVTAGVIGDVEAKALIAGITTMAQARARQKNLNLNQSLKEIAGELQGQERTKAALDRRNHALTKLRFNQFLDRVKSWDTWGEGVAAFLGGSEKTSVKGAGLGLDQMISGLRNSTLRRWYASLDESGSLKDFLKARHGREFFIESGELSKGIAGRPGITNNKSALAMAQAWHSVRSELVSRLNRAGGWIVPRPDYVIRQSHDQDAIRRLGKEGHGEASREQSYQAYKLAVLDLIDAQATFKGADVDTWLRRFHANVYAGVFGANRADNHLADSFTVHGSGLKSASAPRHMHFKDAESAFKYNEMFGTKNFAHAVTGSIDSLTRMIALSESLGPNFETSFHAALRKLEEDARTRDDSARQADSILKNPKISGYWDLLTGKANNSKHPTFSKWIDRIRNIALASKSGGIVISSFSDKPMIQMEAAYQGISALDTLAKQFTALLPRGKARERGLREADVMLSSLAGDINHRWQTDGRNSNDPTQTIVNSVFDLNLSNLWTDKHRSAFANLMAHNVGSNAHHTFDAMPGELQRVLSHYEIGAREWNAIRSTVWNHDGNAFVTVDKFATIPDSLIDPMLSAKQQRHTAANRLRERDLLATKYQAYVSDRVDHAIPSPGLRERYYLTGFGAQRGTLARETFELLAIFKSFPTAVWMKVAGRERYGRGADTAKEWIMRDHKGKMNLALTIAAAGAIGYLSMTVKDALKGRTPKRLFDDDGNINGKVWLASLQQGGGLGIYGDFLFSEYGRQYKSVLGAIAGPALGQLDPLGELITKSRTAALEGDADRASEVPADAFNLALQNVPGQNLFYIKPILDYFIFWNLKEALSPGILRRAESSIEKQNVQEHFITPSEVAPLDFGEKLEYLTE